MDTVCNGNLPTKIHNPVQQSTLKLGKDEGFEDEESATFMEEVAALATENGKSGISFWQRTSSVICWLTCVDSGLSLPTTACEYFLRQSGEVLGPACSGLSVVLVTTKSFLGPVWIDFVDCMSAGPLIRAANLVSIVTSYQ